MVRPNAWRRGMRQVTWIVAGLAALLCAGAGAPARAQTDCSWPPTWNEVASREASGLYALDLTPFERPEHGWAIYAAAASQELGLPCPPTTPAFALALAGWQTDHGLLGTGVMDAATFDGLRLAWQGRRPFLALRARDVCPDPPPETALELAAPEETAGKPVMLRKGALIAYRRMVAQAKLALPEMAADPELLRIVSAFRSPAYDAERCAREGNCDGVVRAQCSAHRTGLAMDLMLGAAPGFAVDSSDDANRLFQVRGAAYRWLVANAARFGFVNYAFEPWHWEWVGEPIVAPPFHN
jgi:D-alanyl-D-alanine carboxypeptidase